MLMLTERAVQALQGAEQLARQDGKPSVEPTHLVRAILARADSMACRVLARLGVDPVSAARALGAETPGDPSREASHPVPSAGHDAFVATRPGSECLEFGAAASEPGGPSRKPAFGRLPFTPAAKGIVERAADEAKALGHRYVGTEHLLLGILAAGGEAGQVLKSLGVDAPRARQALRELLEPGSAGSS